MADPSHRLRRELGLTQVTASGVGIIIGAGIYVLLGPATAKAGGLVWLSFIIAALLCGLTGLSYAELSAMFPRAGAEYDYTREAFPSGVAFVVGWVMTCGLLIATAAVALGFARYLQAFLDVDTRTGAWALLALVTVIALSGIRRSAWVVVALSAVQVGGLAFVTILGIGHLGETDLLEGHGASGVIGAAALVFFAFIGFDEVTTLVEETNDPTRNMPRALLLALGISTVLYAAVAIAAVSVLSPNALARSTRPLADVMTHVLGGSGVDAMAVVALLTTANTTLLVVTAASRMAFGMGAGGSLPRSVTIVNRRGAPWVAVTIVAIAAAGFVGFGDLTLVAGATDFAVYAVFLAVNATVIVLRVRRPEAPRAFRVPIAIGRIPVIPVLAGLVTLAMIPQLEADAIWIGLALVVTGAIAYPIFRRPVRRSA